MNTDKKNEREPLASPFELAQLAISIATMRGVKTPDLEDAIQLLRSAALRVQEEKRPRAHSATGVPVVVTEAEAERMRAENPLIKVISAEKNPEEKKSWISSITATIPCADEIHPPKKFPVTRSGFWRAVLGTRPSEKHMATTEEHVAQQNSRLATRLQEKFKQKEITNEMSFWWLVHSVAPLLPRFAQSYGAPAHSKAMGAGRERTTEGQFKSGIRRAVDGTFRKKAPSSQKKI
jgi:hypothetical protein